MAKHLPEDYNPDDSFLSHGEPEVGENEPSLKFPRPILDDKKESDE